jgi:hypothetical protein
MARKEFNPADYKATGDCNTCALNKSTSFKLKGKRIPGSFGKCVRIGGPCENPKPRIGIGGNLSSWSEKKDTAQVARIMTEDGDLWEARKEGQNEPWTVTYPEGEFRFYGSEPEVRAEMRRVMKSLYKPLDQEIEELIDGKAGESQTTRSSEPHEAGPPCGGATCETCDNAVIKAQCEKKE